MKFCSSEEQSLYDELLIPDSQGEYQLVRVYRNDDSRRSIMNDISLASALNANSLLADDGFAHSFSESFQHAKQLVEFWLCTASPEEKQAELMSFDIPIEGLESFLILMNVDHLIHLMNSMPMMDCLDTIDSLIGVVIDQNQEAEALELIRFRLASAKEKFLTNPIIVDPANNPVSSSITKIEMLESFVEEKILSLYKGSKIEKFRKMISPSELAELSAFIYYGLGLTQTDKMLTVFKKMSKAFDFEFNESNSGSTLNNLKKRFKLGKRKKDWSFIEEMLEKAKIESVKFKTEE